MPLEVDTATESCGWFEPAVDEFAVTEQEEEQLVPIPPLGAMLTAAPVDAGAEEEGPDVEVQDAATGNAVVDDFTPDDVIRDDPSATDGK